MSRYIDAELIEKHIKREDHYTPDERWRPESEFAKFIDSIPTADVVEVVRCADCKYQGNDDECPLLSLAAYTEPDDFCSYGEKRWSK